MENLNLNDDGAMNANHPALSQAELLDLCLIGRVVVNKLVHLCTIEERLGSMWQSWRKITLMSMEDNKYMVQLL